MHEIEWGDQEIQEIIDIRPSKVTVVESEDNSDQASVLSGKSWRLDPNLFEYFGFSDSRSLDKGTLSDIREIKKSLFKEFESVDDWFKFLRIVERQFEDRDGYKRVLNVRAFLKIHKGNLSRFIRHSDLIDPMEIYVEHARETGNWSEVLKLARKREGKTKA